MVSGKRAWWESVRDDNDDDAAQWEPIVLTVQALSVKHLRGGTRVASTTNLDTSYAIT
jgi:hypothetical protein